MLDTAGVERSGLEGAEEVCGEADASVPFWAELDWTGFTEEGGDCVELVVLLLSGALLDWSHLLYCTGE